MNIGRRIVGWISDNGESGNIPGYDLVAEGIVRGRPETPDDENDGAVSVGVFVNEAIPFLAYGGECLYHDSVVEIWLISTDLASIKPITAWLVDFINMCPPADTPLPGRLPDTGIAESLNDRSIDEDFYGKPVQVMSISLSGQQYESQEDYEISKIRFAIQHQDTTVREAA